MRFNSLRPEYPVTASVCGADEREDTCPRGLGGSSNRLAGRVRHNDSALVVKEWRSTVPKLAPNSERRARSAGVQLRVSEDVTPAGVSGWRARITSAAAIVVELWSRMRRQHEFRRLSLGWERVDRRTLKDIGVSRYEVEYARNARYWS
jgi:uncharacterized protein YjiS (DUF1127 family)